MQMDHSSLLSLPRDILILLPDYLHTIEDYVNIASTCRTLRDCMDAASPRTILRLAAAQTKVFFRPSPHFLVAATARELGDWARQSDANEDELARRVENGMDGLLDLALEHCGLTMQRIRELHLMRFSIMNPVTDIIDQCVGKQWYAAPDFWNGGRSDAYTISAEPYETLFHLATYGELFGPGFETILNQDATTRRLRVDTRLEYIKYCLPDFACHQNRNLEPWNRLPDGTMDPRRAVKETGPYKQAPNEDGNTNLLNNHNLALTWTIGSSRWRPHWRRARERAGVDEFKYDFDDAWWYDESHQEENKNPETHWRQRMLESVMICQGLEGLGMIRPELQDQWFVEIREWKNKIAMLESEPALTEVGRQATLEYPYLLGDLRICASGYVAGT